MNNRGDDDTSCIIMGIVARPWAGCFIATLVVSTIIINYCNAGFYGISSMGGTLKGHPYLNVKAPTTKHGSFHD
jgi:hypothetical protein